MPAISDLIQWIADQLHTAPHVVVVAIVAIVCCTLFIFFCCCCAAMVWCIRRRRPSRRSYWTVMTDEDEQRQIDIENTVYYSTTGTTATAAGGGGGGADDTGSSNRRTHNGVSDMDIMNAKMYLRSTRFEFVKPVPQIGRNHKVAILLKNRTKSKERHLMTIVDKYPHSDIIATEKDKLALVSLLESLDHPYLYPVDDFDYFVPKGQAYVIRRVAERGSLKDLIYGVKSPLHAWNDKYGRVTQGQLLGTQQCAVYGRQILDGLKALQTIGLRFPHLATSNIMMCKHGNSGELVCRISELENTFLALPPRYSSYFEPLNDRVSEEVIAFGHVLFEMATGREMRSVKPPRKDLNRLAEPLQRVLRNIFDMEQQIGSVTVDSLIEDSFFTVTMNNNALVEIVDPNPLKSIRPQHRALLDKLAEYVREHNGMSEPPSEFHKSSTALMRKKQYRQEEFLARSLGSVPANSGQWLNMTGQGE